MIGKVLVILGATGIGKTSLAIQLAEALNGEIISADSRQIYRYMDIGTAKPTPDECARVPHHAISIVNPDQTLSLAEYLELAHQATQDILQRGKRPLLVGGTGQYITAFCEGWTIPRVPPNPSLRSELEAFAAEHGAAALHQRLQVLDADYAAKTHPNNVRRVIRALEVCLLTSTTMTQQQRKQAPPYTIRTWGLTMPREALYARTDQRIDAMLAAGFLAEVERLLMMGYSRQLASMSGLGYAELTAHLLDGLPLGEAIQQTKYHTHNFIRRQEVWFRGHDNGILWHNVESLSALGISALIGDLKHWYEAS